LLISGANVTGRCDIALAKVSRLDELADGQMKMVMAGEKEVLLARVSGKVYATQNRCQHLGGDLSRGTLAGTVVTCPRHQSQYDVRDGRVLRWTDWSPLVLFFAKIFKPPRPLQTYPVKIDGDDIYIDI
jgi:3-phenylpropionate/trans-cinnamate dioxygenase ferredoxin component